MIEKLAHVVRRERTSVELKRLKLEITAWLAQAAALDVDDLGNPRAFYKSRLETLSSVLLGAADKLEKLIAKIDLSIDRKTGDVYKDCRDYDQSIAWLRRVFTFYQEKFDQRAEKTTFLPLLEAADEIIWSCYREVYAQLKWKVADLEQPPYPLAYFAPDYSPAAWNPLKGAPSELSSTMPVTGIEDFVRRLPLGLVRLPPWCVVSPWWLIFIAHEVGHHIQANLELIEPFKQLASETALKCGLLQGQADRWGVWAEEVFADLFSVMMMGKSAAEALIEVEWSTPEDMAARRREYPQAMVRLGLIDAAVSALELGKPLAEYGLDAQKAAEAYPEISAHLPVARDLLEKAQGAWNATFGRMRDWCNADVMINASTAPDDEEASIRYWAGRLPKEQTFPSKSLALPRIILCGGFQAWKTLVAEKTNEADRQAGLSALRQNLVDALRRSGQPGTRAPTPADETRGADLAGLLVRASQTREVVED